MFFVDLLQEVEIWALGDSVGFEGRGKPAQARAELPANVISSIQQTQLRIVPDPQPHPRHVDIAGWPPEKDAQKAIALDLCAASTLHIRATGQVVGARSSPH